jgi:WD40 repeat protein
VITDLAISPDGRTLATGCVDRSVRLWNVAVGQELLTLHGHTGPVHSVAFAPNGRSLASCGDGPDGSIEVIVWHAAHPSQGPR